MTSTDGALCHSGVAAANRPNWDFRRIFWALQIDKQFPKLTRSDFRRVAIRTLFFVDKGCHEKNS